MAAASCPIPQEAIDAGREAIACLPALRRVGDAANPAQLKAILDLVGAYIAAPTTKAPPSKELLSEAVQSLLPAGKRLARKWRKEQLATVLMKWTVQALRLRPFSQQKFLLVQVRVSDANPKQMTHSCFLQEQGSENIAAFALTSPSPVKSAFSRLVSEASAGSAPSSAIVPPEFEGLDGLDETFLKEIDELAARADLAAIPTDFYTPRVPSVADGEVSHTGEDNAANDFARVELDPATREQFIDLLSKEIAKLAIPTATGGEGWAARAKDGSQPADWNTPVLETSPAASASAGSGRSKSTPASDSSRSSKNSSQKGPFRAIWVNFLRDRAHMACPITPIFTLLRCSYVH